MFLPSLRAPGVTVGHCKRNTRRDFLKSWTLLKLFHFACNWVGPNYCVMFSWIPVTSASLEKCAGASVPPPQTGFYLRQHCHLLDKSKSNARDSGFTREKSSQGQPSSLKLNLCQDILSSPNAPRKGCQPCVSVGQTRGYDEKSFGIFAVTNTV